MESSKPKENEQEVAMKYKQLQNETSILIQKIMELEDEKKENEYIWSIHWALG